MDNNENFVTEEITENVETTTTEEKVEETKPTEKLFTQDEVNEIVKNRNERTAKKLRREYERKYSNAEYLQNVVKAGLETENIEEATDTLAQFYSDKGKSIPSRPNAQIYSPKDIEMLARADAEEIINSGYDDIVEEVDRLASLGVENMTAREKAAFRLLAEHRTKAENKKSLLELGVTEEEFTSKDFTEFASKFNDKTPIAEVYKIYAKTKPQKDIKTMGSMRNTPNDKVKDFYTAEEISRLTEEELDNPDVWNAVRRSMTGV